MTTSGGRSADLWGGVLVGGASRRMGEPKQLLRFRGATLLELAVAALAPHVAGVVLLGDGPVPEGVAGLPRLTDVVLPRASRGAERTSVTSATPAADPRTSAPPPGAGPLAGMLAALRWKPDAAWIFAPCDLPLIDARAVAWLVGERRPDRRVVVPRPEAGGPLHALFALYEPEARPLLEDLVAAGGRAPRLIAGHPEVAVVIPPPARAGAWRGVNTRAELATLGGGGGD